MGLRKWKGRKSECHLLDLSLFFLCCYLEGDWETEKGVVVFFLCYKNCAFGVWEFCIHTFEVEIFTSMCTIWYVFVQCLRLQRGTIPGGCIRVCFSVWERERNQKKCPNFIYSTWEKQSFFLRFLGDTKLIGAFYFCLLCLCPIWIIIIKKSNVIMWVASCLNYELPNLFGLLIMARLTINMSLLWHLNFASP